MFGRVGVELVISGPGLVNIYQFTHQSFGTGPTITPNTLAPAELCAGVDGSRDYAGLPGRIYQVGARTAVPALRGSLRHVRLRPTDPRRGTSRCARSPRPVSISAAASRPKILPALESGLFLEAFRAKEPMADLVATIPVSVILNPDSGLLGAAVRAMALSPSR